MADHQQLLIALVSLSNSIEQYMPHSANCVKCKKNKRRDLIELLADSGASLDFTHEQSDLSEFQEVHDNEFDVQTATKSPPLAVKGVGCMFLMTSMTSGIRSERLFCLYPVFYIPGINHRFLSVGTLLNQGLMLRGSSSCLEFRSHKSNRLEIMCEPHELGVKILKTSKSHFAIGSDPIELKALHYHYLDLTYPTYLGRPRISSLSFD